MEFFHLFHEGAPGFMGSKRCHASTRNLRNVCERHRLTDSLFASYLRDARDPPMWHRHNLHVIARLSSARFFRRTAYFIRIVKVMNFFSCFPCFNSAHSGAASDAQAGSPPQAPSYPMTPMPAPQTRQYPLTIPLHSDTPLSEERQAALELSVQSDGFVYQNGRRFSTGEWDETRYVMDGSGRMFADRPERDPMVDWFPMNHSSFLRGEPAAAAGELTAHGGVIQSMNNLSGHYGPLPAHMQQMLDELQARGVNTSQIATTFHDQNA
jgi:hypothetical protein